MAIISIIGGDLYQWDTGRKVKLTPPEGITIDEVHFNNYTVETENAPVVKTRVENGELIADIPNFLFHEYLNLTVYAVMVFADGKSTKCGELFTVYPRPKPADYVYTEIELKNYEALEERIKELEENGGGGGGINPEQLQTVIDEALRKAKESGEFDGADGKDGKDGADGKDGLNGKDGADGKTAYQYAKDGGYTGTEEEFAQKMAKELPTKLSDLENDLELEVEGTVEITDGEPTKESTVLTLNPNAEEVNLYTAEEIDAKLQNLPSGGETWRTIREFDISNEEGIATDNSGITWTVDDSGNITAFEFDTDADGQTFSANKLRWCICPPDTLINNQAIFGGKRGYLNVFCNSNANGMYTGSLYNATNTVGGWRIESLIECDMSGTLRQVSYMGADRNSYGNEKPHLNFFNTPGLGYPTPPIQKFKIACDSGIWFVSGAKVLVQVCEEV